MSEAKQQQEAQDLQEEQQAIYSDTEENMSNEEQRKEESKETKKDTKQQKTNEKNKKNVIVNSTHKETMSFRCEQFFGKNWKYVTFFLGICILVCSYELNYISGKINDLEQVVLENNEKVVLTTSDGRAIKVTKEPLKAEYLKQFAVSTYVNSFIVSRSQLTNNFETSSFKDYGEVMDNVPQIRNVLVNFMDYKNDKEKGIKINEAAVGDLRGYVQWLISATSQDKLPEYIAIKDYSVEKYEYSGNKFTIEILIKVVTQNYIIAENTYKQQSGVFKISSEGSFDLNKSSDINPYGMRIERLKIEPVVKAKSA